MRFPHLRNPQSGDNVSTSFDVDYYEEITLLTHCKGGGIGWGGSTTCVSGSNCVKTNDYYSQCQPGAAPPVTVAPPVTTPATTVVVPPSSTPVTSAPTGPSGSCPTLPSNPTLVTNAKLPDPFLPMSGARVTTKSAWKCRQQEISQLFQRYELGTLPPKPSSVTASYSSGTLTINCSEGGKSISFTASITYPSSGKAPYPAIIGNGGMSIPQPAGVAVINFNNNDIAAQTNTGSRGQGKFYTLYGSTHSASAMMAWSWGISRIIDALEITAGANINTARIGVTGCSRNGKGAIVAGAFDERIALTIPQESGSGGSACWRISDSMKNSGKNVQTASQIITENVWFSKSFEQYVTSVGRLPLDHHMLAALVAPRGLFIIENTSQEWLGNESCFGCMKAAHKVWEALGVPDSMGVSQVGNHNHCAFPSSQQSELTAFINKFLLDQSTNTAIMRTDGGYTLNEAQWVDWTVPTLQ